MNSTTPQTIGQYRKRNWTDREFIPNYDETFYLSNKSIDHLNLSSSLINNTTMGMSTSITTSETISNTSSNKLMITPSATTTTTLGVTTTVIPPPVKRVANERERTRTASVNDAFIMLRNLIPTEPINRKLSKIETLRLASSYISHLSAVLVTGSSPTDQPCLKHQQYYYSNQNKNHSNNNNGCDLKYSNKNPHRPVCTFCVTELKQHQRASVTKSSLSPLCSSPSLSSTSSSPSPPLISSSSKTLVTVNNINTTTRIKVNDLNLTTHVPIMSSESH